MGTEWMEWPQNTNKIGKKIDVKRQSTCFKSLTLRQ